MSLGIFKESSVRSLRPFERKNLNELNVSDTDMKTIILGFVVALLLLNVSIFHNFQIANAQNTSTNPSLKTVTDNINKKGSKAELEVTLPIY